MGESIPRALSKSDRLVTSVLLSSLTNPTVKHLVRMRDNRARRKAGRVMVDGWRETQQAIDGGLKPIGIYASEESESENVFLRQTERVVRARFPELLREVSPSVMAKISYGQSARGVVAEFDVPSRDLSSLSSEDVQLVLVLDRIEKPGNLGAAFRCADAAGVDAVIVTPQQSDLFNPNAIRSSLGSVFSVPAATADESSARKWLKDRDIQVLAARVEASKPLWETDLTGKVALVIGSESHGLEDRWQAGDDITVEGVHLPMFGHVDSLNASVSAAVMLYEAKRQRLT